MMDLTAISHCGVKRKSSTTAPSLRPRQVGNLIIGNNGTRYKGTKVLVVTVQANCGLAWTHAGKAASS